MATWAFCSALSSASVPGTPISLPPKTSWIIGEAMPMTPMPALTLRQSTPQRHQNCGVFQAGAHVHVAAGDHGLAPGPSGVQPAGFQSGRRHPVAERAAQHGDEVDGAHGEEGLAHAHRGRGGEVLHQHVGQRRADQGAAAESHDRHAGGHAAPVGEPLDQGGDRRDVAQAEAAAADDARSRARAARADGS